MAGEHMLGCEPDPYERRLIEVLRPYRMQRLADIESIEQQFEDLGSHWTDGDIDCFFGRICSFGSMRLERLTYKLMILLSQSESSIDQHARVAELKRQTRTELNRLREFTDEVLTLGGTLH